MPIATPTYPAARSKRTPSKPPLTQIGGGRKPGGIASPGGFGAATAGALGAGHVAAGAPAGSAGLTMPPPGTYDPIIDAQVRAGQRGLGDLSEDTILGNSRASQDYNTQKEQTDTTSGWTLADLLTNRDRQLADYQTQRENTDRGYQNLGVAQAGSAAAHGLSGSGVTTGALGAALQARAANEGRDMAVIQTGVDRTNADYNSAHDRAVQQQTWADSGLATDLQRGTDNRGIALGRAQREQNFYGQDAAREAMYQATTSGLYTPPPAPAPKKGAGAGSSKPAGSGRATTSPSRPNVATGSGSIKPKKGKK